MRAAHRVLVGVCVAAAAGLALATAATESTADSAPGEGCVELKEVEAAILQARWLTSLATGHPDKVLRNYAADAVLIGHDTNAVRTTPAAIRDFYVQFLAREPQVRMESRTLRLGCHTASDAGVHQMTLKSRTRGPNETILVRYSFIYERRDGSWLIVHHHASILPEKAPAAPAVASFVKRTAGGSPKAGPGAAPPAAAKAPARAAEPAEPEGQILIDPIFGRVTVRYGFPIGDPPGNGQ
jgi:uncharacterized protein (TIGR02246 family)